MNLFQLVLKNMRQRALSTWLTLISVMLGVGLAVAVIIMAREANQLFGQTDYGYDIVVGKKGSGLQLVLNVVYHMEQSQGNIPYSDYEAMLDPKQYRADVKIAVPYCVGDTYKGIYRIVGTASKLFGINDDDGQPLPPERVMQYRLGERFKVAQGKVFNPDKFEALIGSEVARQTGLKIGDTFQATHGLSAPLPGQVPDIHPEVWTVCGILEPTYTANDRVLFIPILTFYTIGEHSKALKAQYYLNRGIPFPANIEDEDKIPVYTLRPDGTIDLLVPKEEWEVSAILVASRGGVTTQTLLYDLNNGTNVMAVNPASTMRDFFDTFLAPLQKLLVMNYSLVTIVAAVAILVSIYNSVSARMREIAILRALGATRVRIMTLICTEAGLIALVGGLLGMIGAHAVAAVGSAYMAQRFGEKMDWMAIDKYEPVYIAGVVVVALIAGLVPALKAYRSPVATNLVAV